MADKPKIETRTEYKTERGPTKSPAAKPDPSATSSSDDKDDLKSLAMPDVFKTLGSSKDGLSATEAAKRLTKYGPNAIAEKTANPFLKFLRATLI